MMKTPSLATLLALSAVAVLPACSMFGGGDKGSRSSSVGGSGQSHAAAPNFSASPQMATAPELTPDMIRSVQTTLQQNGTYRGRVDGVWGPGTQAAVRDYQQQHNMNATGQLDQDTLTALNLNSGSSQSNAQQPPQQPPSQRYGTNYNPPPNSNPAPADSANPPPPANTR